MMTVGIKSNSRAYLSAVMVMTAILTCTETSNWPRSFEGSPFITISLGFWHVINLFS